MRMSTRQSECLVLCTDPTLQTRLLQDMLATAFGPWQLLLPDQISELPDDCRLLLMDASCLEADTSRQWLSRLDCLAGELAVAGIFNVAVGDPHEQLASVRNVYGLFGAQVTQHQLTRGIETILQGRLALPDPVLGQILQRVRQAPVESCQHLADLTPREREILAQLSAGATNQGIADTLGISTHTIKTHIYNLFRKLGVRNRVQAVQLAGQYLEVDLF